MYFLQITTEVQASKEVETLLQDESGEYMREFQRTFFNLYPENGYVVIRNVQSVQVTAVFHSNFFQDSKNYTVLLLIWFVQNVTCVPDKCSRDLKDELQSD